MKEQNEDFSLKPPAQPVSRSSDLSDERFLEEALRRYYHPTTKQSANTLERARARILHSQEKMATQAQSVGQISQFARREQAKELHMETPVKRSGNLSRFLSIAAAIVVVGIVVGSMLALPRMLRPSTNSADIHVQAKASPTPIPPEPDAPGIYMIITGTDYVVEKLDSKTHTPVWKYILSDGQGLGTPLTVKGQTVYVAYAGREENYIDAFSAQTGKLRWRIALNKYTMPDATSKEQAYYLGMLDAATVSDGVLYIMARSGRMLAIDSTNGHVRWVYNSGSQAVVKDGSQMLQGGKVIVDGSIYECGKPAVHAGVVYGTCHNTVFAVSASQGKQLWTQHIDKMQIFNDPQFVDGSLYLASYEASHHTDGQWMKGTVSAYDVKSGARRWVYPVNNWLLGNPVVVGGIVYFGSFDQNVYALNASDGSKVWIYKTKGQIRDTPLVSNGVVYIDQQGVSQGDNAATGTPSVLALQANSGKLIWEKEINGSPVALHDGVLYVSAANGLVGLKTSDGSTMWRSLASYAIVIVF